MSFISRGFTSHHTGTVPLCSTTGATSSIDRTSMDPSDLVAMTEASAVTRETSAMSDQPWREEWEDQADRVGRS